MALISIVIITYNFEKIILECLESLETELDDIYEVIITDDGSNDKTLELCYQWREKNKDKIRIVILESKVNEGVVKNINKGCKIVKGEWIKLLAGDDILIEGSIKKIQNFINKNFEAEIIFSKVIPFYVKNEKKNYLKVLPKELDFYNKNFKKQLDELLEGNCIVAPGAIIKSELLRKMNYFDEKFKMVEDYPFWIKLLKNNIKFYFFNQEIVMYRKSENSVSGKGKSKKVNKYMLEFEIQFFKEIYLKEIKNPIRRWDKYISIKRKEIIFNSGNRSNLLTQMMRWLEVRNLKKYIFRILLVIIVIKIYIKYFYK